MEIRGIVTHIAQRMFVETADQDYILARVAHLNGLDINFYWLSLHAIEKYLKAILLINGQSAQSFGHDINRLHKAIIKFNPSISFGPFQNPHIEDLFWHDLNVADFMKRLCQYGSAQNRYMTYGYEVTLDDLIKVDQLVWSVRRYCRPLMLTFKHAGREHIIDQVDQLKRNTQYWRLSNLFPIEALLDGKRGDALRSMFCYLNTAFAPNIEHTLLGWRGASANPPLVDYFEGLRSPSVSPEGKALAASVLRWAISNLDYNKQDREVIERAIAKALPTQP